MRAVSLKPLAGLRIMVTRPKQQVQALSEKLQQLGASAIELPTIEILPIEDTGPLDRAIRNLESYDWVIFTSVHGVRFFMERLKTLKASVEVLKARKIAAVGAATASELECAVKRPDYVPKEYLTEKIASGLGGIRGKRILLPRADIASKKLPSLLRKLGAQVDDAVAYRTITPRDLGREKVVLIFERGVDVVTFTSPSTVRNLVQVLGENQFRRFLRRTTVACIGPVTAEAVKELGIDVGVVARNHTIDALVEAIANEAGTL